ncbi:hypothetical protein FD906_02170 [Acinetobacter baumannii]|nr:hypothetical protein FD906_02170 [Acinetobacter baumannii]
MLQDSSLATKAQIERNVLQKCLDEALKQTQYALQYVEEDMRGNFEFLQMAMIRTFKELEKELKSAINQNKYDWEVIPANVKFMATDEDGMACGWLVEPHIVGNAWRNQSHLSAHFYLTRCRNPFRGDWKDSLEKRPEVVEQKNNDGEA